MNRGNLIYVRQGYKEDLSIFQLLNWFFMAFNVYFLSFIRKIIKCHVRKIKQGVFIVF